VTLAQASGPLFRWDWVFRNLGEIWDRVIEHLVLTGIAVGIGLVISLGLSLIALRWRRTYAPITWVAGILYTIPSLALFAMLVPITGLSTTTAEVGLVSYTLLILVRNIVAGIDGVSPDIKEAALGMGFTRRRLFLQIELPLALPVIVAGIRIAAVTVIGLVTVTSIIGQGGLGFFILRGLNSFFWTQIIVGVVLSVLLAVVIDVALSRGERALTPWAKARQAS
jgi:osmoprotectant transport system permease protein